MPLAQGFLTIRPRTLAFHLLLLLRPSSPFFIRGVAFFGTVQDFLAPFQEPLETAEHQVVVDSCTRVVCRVLVIIALRIQVDYFGTFVVFFQLAHGFAEQQLYLAGDVVENPRPLLLVDDLGRWLDFHVVQAVDCSGVRLEVLVEKAQSLQEIKKKLEII